MSTEVWSNIERKMIFTAWRVDIWSLTVLLEKGQIFQFYMQNPTPGKPLTKVTFRVFHGNSQGSITAISSDRVLVLVSFLVLVDNDTDTKTDTRTLVLLTQGLYGTFYLALFRLVAAGFCQQ